MAMGEASDVDGLPDALPETDRNQQVLTGQEPHVVKEIATAADRRFGIEPQRDQSIG